MGKLIRNQRSTARRRPALLLLTVFAVFLCQMVFIRFAMHPVEVRKVNEAHMIHLVSTVVGVKDTRQFLTAMKSLLFHQGRCRIENKLCRLQTVNGIKRTCVNMNIQRRSPLTVHLITDGVARRTIEDYFKEWNLDHLHIIFYREEIYTARVKMIPNSHFAGIPSMVKMELPNIIPPEVKKIILLDTDILFNQNVEYLWRKFAEFNKTQAIGGAYLQQEEHIDRLKAMGWPFLDIVNVIIAQHPDIFYEFACEWNVMLTHYYNSSYCPITDIFHKDNLAETPGANMYSGVPNLVHMAGRGKPELQRSSVSLAQPTIPKSGPLKGSLLRRIFTHLYFQFRKLPKVCFH